MSKKYKCFDCRVNFEKIYKCEECGVYLCWTCSKLYGGVCEECHEEKYNTVTFNE